MQYNFMFRAIGMLFGGMMKEKVPDRAVRKKVQSSYKDIVLRAKDIGAKNRLLGSYAMAAFFIAMNREDGLSAEENCGILEEGLRRSRVYRAFMGDAKSYFSEKNMASRRAWSKESYKRKYENDWVVDVLEKTDDYEFGFDYHECGAVKLFRDEGCPQWAKYLCRLDWMTTEIMGVHLERTMTLAEGGEKCDFRFSRLPR